LRSSRRRNVTEFEDNATSHIGIEADERRNGVKRIKQEMGIDLAGERIHASFEEKLLMLLEIHLDARVVPDLDWRRHGHHCGENHEDQAPIVTRVNGEEPCWLGGAH
jgi:hypothetical protein